MKDLQVGLSAVSAATALIAVVVGPVVSLRIAKRQAETELENTRRQVEANTENARRQIRAATVVANRQSWINALRTDLAQFTAVAVMFVVARRKKGGDPANSFAKKLLFLQTRVCLSLNPAESDHIELIKLIHTVVNKAVRVGETDVDRQENGIRQDLETLTTLSQSILKREWERVKAGD